MWLLSMLEVVGNGKLSKVIWCYLLITYETYFVGNKLIGNFIYETLSRDPNPR